MGKKTRKLGYSLTDKQSGMPSRYGAPEMSADSNSGNRLKPSDEQQRTGRRPWRNRPDYLSAKPECGIWTKVRPTFRRENEPVSGDSISGKMWKPGAGQKLTCC